MSLTFHVLVCFVDRLDQEPVDGEEALEGDSEVLTVIHPVTAGGQEGGCCQWVRLQRRERISRMLNSKLYITWY